MSDIVWHIIVIANWIPGKISIVVLHAITKWTRIISRVNVHLDLDFMYACVHTQLVS